MKGGSNMNSAGLGDSISEGIAKLREDKGYTQKDLAEKLAITEKDIKFWEEERETPQTTLSKKIDMLSENNRTSPISSAEYTKEIFNTLDNVLLIIAGCVMAFLPIILATANNYQYYVYGAFLIIVAVLRIIFKHNKVSILKSYKALYSFTLITMITAIVLEFSQKSVTMACFDGANKSFITTFSYFSFVTPITGAMFTQLLTGLLSVAIVVLSVIILIKNSKLKRTRNANLIISIIAFLISLLVIFLNQIAYSSMINHVISLLLLLSVPLQFLANRKIYKE